MSKENPTVSEEIITVLDDLTEKAGVAIDWTEENVMPQVMEALDGLILYKIVINALLVALPIFAIIFLAIVAKKYMKVDPYDEETKYYILLILLITAGATVICSFIAALCSVGELIGWATMPEIKIIEYVANLVGGN